MAGWIVFWLFVASCNVEIQCDDNPLVIGGTVAEPRMFNYMVMVHKTAKVYQAGLLVTPVKVITTKLHKEGEDYILNEMVVVPRINPTDNRTVVWVHQIKELSGGVAVLFVQRPFLVARHYYLPAPMSYCEPKLYTSSCKLAGWSSDKFGKNPYEVRYLTAAIAPDEKCKEQQPEKTDTMFCALSDEETTAWGDYGGPIECENEVVGLLVNTGCNAVNYPFNLYIPTWQMIPYIIEACIPQCC